MNIKIAVCHHKPTPFCQTEQIIPVHAGKAKAHIDLGFPGDDSGDNISHKNDSWCELTVLYWMWKNVTADYYGLFHYRRYICFTPAKRATQSYEDTGAQFIAENGLTPSIITKACSQADIITPDRIPVHPVGVPGTIYSCYDQYAQHHYKRDLDKVLLLSKTLSPHIYPYVLKTMASKTASFFNMFIMKKEFFNEYAEWLFPLLEAAEAQLDISSYDPFQRRIWGFLSERLLNAYVDYAVATHKASYATYPVTNCLFNHTNIDRTTLLKNINSHQQEPKDYSPDTINIVFSTDENYMQHCVVAMCSLLENAHPEQKIAIFILHGNELSEKSKQQAITMVQGYPLASLTFIPTISSLFSLFKLNRPHITAATYYRLLIHTLLPKSVHKVIYLDSDIVVVDNIAKLWAFELGENYVAGAPDEAGIPHIRRLCISERHIYYNAGVMLFDLDKIRSFDALTHYLEVYFTNHDTITLQDQDILNIAYLGKSGVLPLRWNANSKLYRVNKKDTAYSKDEADKAANNPAIIHFTAKDKPWHFFNDHPLKGVYFDYLQKSNWPWSKKAYEAPKRLGYNVKGAYVDLWLCGVKITVATKLVLPFYLAWQKLKSTVKTAK